MRENPGENIIIKVSIFFYRILGQIKIYRAVVILSYASLMSFSSITLIKRILCIVF